MNKTISSKMLYKFEFYKTLIVGLYEAYKVFT